MVQTILVARASVIFSVLAATLGCAASSFADDVAASSAASGTVSAKAASTPAPAVTTSHGNVGFQTGSQVIVNGQQDGAARSNSQAVATAGASAGVGSVALALSSGASTAVSSAGGNKNAVATAAAAGSVGAAQLNLSAQAKATSGPGQMTASANATDGSFALAEKGVVNRLVTFTPGGVTTLLHNGDGSQSVSCNASGTCSQASVQNNSVSAGIRIFGTADRFTAGNANAVLHAFLNVEARAGWQEVSATASSYISGGGSSNGRNYSAQVSATLRTSGTSRIWLAPSADHRGAGFAAVNVWRMGDSVCVSTQVHVGDRRDKLQTFAKCRHLKPHHTVAALARKKWWAD